MRIAQDEAFDEADDDDRVLQANRWKEIENIRAVAAATNGPAPLAYAE